MKPSTPKLSEVARHLVIPEGIVSTGWPAVRDTCRQLGIEFDSWQAGIGQAALGKRADGLYAADSIAMSIPRQVGKTFLVGWITFALCLAKPGLTVIWTAHRYKTASETYEQMRGMARRPKLAPHVEKVPQGAGNQAVIFRNGSRILFGARERGFGRGFTGVDVLVFDESQILTDGAIDDMVPATNHSPNPLIWYVGTPPKPDDPGEVFARHRAEALSGEALDALYVELSADIDADPGDRAQWRKANPSFPGRVPERSMLRVRKNLTPEAWLREGLGIWLPTLGSERPVDALAWEECRDVASERVGDHVLCIDVSPNRRTASMAMAGIRPDGLPMVMVVRHGTGTDWLVEHVKDVWQSKGPLSVVIDKAGQAHSFAQELTDAGVAVRLMQTADMADACGDFSDAVAERRIRHRGQETLDVAVVGAAKRNLGDRWAFRRRDSSTDITPLVACAGALWGLSRPESTGGWAVSL